MSRVANPAAARGDAVLAGAINQASGSRFGGQSGRDVLASGGQLGRIHDGPTDDDLAIQRTYTKAATAGIQKPAGVPNSVFDAGKLARPARYGAPFDAAGVVIEHGLPVPVGSARGIGQVYELLLERMATGDSAVLPTHQAKGLKSKATKLGINLTVRAVSSTQMRVWRMAGAPGKYKRSTGRAA